MSGLLPADAAALGVGAFFGALSRYQCGRLAADWVASDPNRLGRFAGWHTAGINVGGSFLLGCITAAPSANVKAINESTKAELSNPTRQIFAGLSPRTRLMLGVGFCGSFTTFSTYSVDVVSWITDGKTSTAMKYVVANNIGGLLAAAAGMALMKRIVG